MAKKFNALQFTISFFLFLLWMLSSCTKEFYYDKNEPILKFSEDSILFDTVFTTIGSATQSIKIYNPTNEFVKIQRIYIPNSQNSKFSLNVDGFSGKDFQDIVIRPKDSIYLFCEVLINPNDPISSSPFIILDSVVFEVNKSVQKVILEAWGQNAIYIPAKSNKANFAIIDLKGKTELWNDQKPYILYGIVLFRNGTLKIEPGTKIHVFGGITKAIDSEGNTFFYNDGRLLIGQNANIICNGTLEKNIVFQGVRLEEQFKSIRGQWSTISIIEGSLGNEFHHTTILNNQIGVTIDSSCSCDFFSCKIYNNSIYGIYSNAGNLYAENCLFYNQGLNSLVSENGGSIVFNYTTFANYGNMESAVIISNFKCVDPVECLTKTYYPLDAKFTNCIFTGEADDEFWMESVSNAEFNVALDHCFINSKKIKEKDYFPNFVTQFTQNCIFNSNQIKLFKNSSKENFQLDTLSSLENRAIPIAGISKDLLGKTRDQVMPDIGCYEYEK
ncbi:MAG TPA: hypothetical protein PK006_05225 [Saprospiraceae bacterium]|nr:hypothetical protein [Saprospiraceae bacterium]